MTVMGNTATVLLLGFQFFPFQLGLHALHSTSRADPIALAKKILTSYTPWLLTT